MRTLFTAFLMVAISALSAQEFVTDGNCKAFFKYEVNDKLMMPYAATAINFYDQSTGKVKEWYWDFGEGNTSREQNPMFIFKHPIISPNVRINPYRTVSLTILTDSCKSFYSIMINIFDGKPYVKPDCKAAFKYYIASADSLVGTVKVQFTNLSEGDSLKFLWQLGDGKTSTEKEPLVTFDRKPEKRQVCLSVTGKNKCTDNFCDTVYILPPVDPKPVECFVYFGYAVNTTIKTFAPALVLDFYAKSPSDVISWNWDFGDGTTSTEPNPTHIFNFPLGNDSVNHGSHFYRNVTLTIITQTGCKATWSDTIDVYMNTNPPVDPVERCHAWFKYYRPTDGITIPEVVPYQFNSYSEGKVIKWLWRFENGDSSRLENPRVTFSIFKPTQKVCLTIYTADSCSHTWCETIYIQENKPDSGKLIQPVCPYVMRIKSGFPAQMSSCAGWAYAQVYLKDTLVKATEYKWSTGTDGQEVKNLCPTLTYTVKAKTPDGCVVACTFVFNSDGTIKEIPITWWVNGTRDNPIIQYNLNNKKLTAEWKLSDGTIVRSDSIPLGAANGGSDVMDLIVRDSLGNIIYTEKIALKAFFTGSFSVKEEYAVHLYPNPVQNILHMEYTGNPADKLQFSIHDLSGRIIGSREFRNITSGKILEVDVRALKKGVYLARIVLPDKELIIRKFIK